MALIKCPECIKEISDKATACPHCGFPLNLAITTEEIPSEPLECPNFPADLSLGSPWSNEATMEGLFKKSENNLSNIPEGVIHATLYEKGLKINDKSYSLLLSIHVSQLIDVSETTEVNLAEHKKSVIGRAAVGGLLFGPVGAIVGGLSGVNSAKTEVKVQTKIAVISYWDIENRIPQSIIIRSKNPFGDPRFISKCKNKIIAYLSN